MPTFHAVNRLQDSMGGDYPGLEGAKPLHDDFISG